MSKTAKKMIPGDHIVETLEHMIEVQQKMLQMMQEMMSFQKKLWHSSVMSSGLSSAPHAMHPSVYPTASADHSIKGNHDTHQSLMQCPMCHNTCHESKHFYQNMIEPWMHLWQQWSQCNISQKPQS